ncbi:synaptonemal complex protein 2 isoform X2 [Mugil cephalus]|uniref:synaptonemal complex protein 2 isoform X2 n=1 Tax=Mugil cephalus TaxID=48193 RepID=UPI001FB5F439|nr:synaptonemal complex protein 2 isoform X2 [Mugil cephalus]
MAPGQVTQLESVINEVLKSGDVQALEAFLQRDTYEEPSMKCSQQFLTTFDKLVRESLDQYDPRSASLALASLHKYGKNLKLPDDGQGLSGLIAQGLIQKMAQWFEKCRQLWIHCGPQWDETLFTLSEDFLNALMTVHEACREGTYKITESFLYPVGHLAVDPRIDIQIKKEAIRKFNLILDKMPVELKRDKEILTSQQASDIMLKLAGQIMEGGDYDFQSSLMEALCRMATPTQRKQQADRWFSMGHVASAFTKIRDSEFETACRKFLNMVNGMQGDKRRVYSYPSLEVYLDKYELLMPLDEKLEEFWIDFNLGSRSISFYFSLTAEGGQESHWETICINETEVQSYTVAEKGKTKVLEIKMSEVVVVGAVEGSSLTIHFSSSLDVLQAAQNVYGHNKNKDTSVVQTTREQNSIQFVPESQVSLGESEKNTAPYILPAQDTPVQLVTPAKRRFSESITVITVNEGSVRGGSSLSSVLPLTKSKNRPSLEMVRSHDTTARTCSHSTTPGSTNTAATNEQSKASKQAAKNMVDKYKKNIPLAKAVDMVLSGQGNEDSQDPSFVPDTQPTTGRSMSSTWSKMSVSEILMMPTQKMSLQRPEPRLSSAGQQECQSSSTQKISVSDSSLVHQKLLHNELTQRLQQVLRERNQDPAHKEPAAPKRKMSNVRGNSKDIEQVSSLHTPKVQQAQRTSRGKGKSKNQTSEFVPVTASASDETLQKGMPTKAKDETKRVTSNKEKGDAEVAGNMVKLISSRYKVNTQSTVKGTAENINQSWIPPLFKSRPSFNMSWFSTSKNELSGTVSLTKSHSKTTTNSVNQRSDVFSFSIDTPSSIGVGGTFLPNTSATSHSDINNSSVAKQKPPVEKNKRYVKARLFSDTDTDRDMTEISWLRESARKPKPQVTKYSRQEPNKCSTVPPLTSCESPDILPFSLQPLKGNAKPKKSNMKNELYQPKTEKQPAATPSKAHAASKRPKRAAATSTKNYREPDTDDNLSEPEKPPAPKHSFTDQKEITKQTHEASEKKKTASRQTTRRSTKSQSLSEKRPTSKLEKNFVGQQQEKSEEICSEVSEVKKRKNSFNEQSTHGYSRQESNKSDLKKPSGLKLRPENLPRGSSKFNKKNAITAQKQMSPLKDSWAARQASFCPSPPAPFIEKMRSAERSAPTLDLTFSPLLTPRGSPASASPNPPCQDTPSPVLLLPKPRSTVSSKGNRKPSLLYGAEKNRSSYKTQSVKSVPSLPSLGGRSPALSPARELNAAEIGTTQQHLSSTPQSPLSLSTRPLLTSTLLELDKPTMPSPPPSPFPEDAIGHSCHYGFSKVSSVSRVSLSQSSTRSSVITGGVKSSPTIVLAVSVKTEKTPLSDRDRDLHVSGPIRKRHMTLSSDSEEDEKEERKKSKMRGQRSSRMKPRKLFKSSRPHVESRSCGEKSSLEEENNKEVRRKDRTFKVTEERISEEYRKTINNTVRKTAHGTVAELSSVDEMSQVMSSSHMSSSHWEAEVVDGDMDMDEDSEFPETAVNPSNLCQQLSSELNKKFQNRCKMMEIYNKQSMKAVQQHISSINTQVTKHRTQRLEQVQKVLLEEIHKLEQGDTVLNNMEKDLTMYWKKQTMAFHSYHKQETSRNETLKRALHSNVCHSVEYEERIFTSQMCLIRKDMKSVQDRLLGEMLDGEIKSVKRGLHALFFP